MQFVCVFFHIWRKFEFLISQGSVATCLMGITKLVSWEWEWERLDGNEREWKLHISHFPPTDSWSADTVNLLLFLHSNCRRLLSSCSLWMFTRHCLRWQLDTACVFVKIWLNFYFYSSTVSCTVEFTGNLLSYEILLAVREWQRGGGGWE